MCSTGTGPKRPTILLPPSLFSLPRPPERERIIAGIRRTLNPGGLLILQGYTPKQLEFGTGGPPDAANLYTADLLRKWFGDWDITHLSEHESFITVGSHHHGMSALVDMVARKP